MDSASSSTALILAAVGSIATLVLSIVKIWVDYLNKGREHQWLVDQEERLEKQRTRVADSIKIQQAVTAADLKKHTDSQTEAIAAKIDENTAFNVEAINLTNNLSEKIRKQGLQLREASRKTDKPDDEPVGV